MKEKLNKNINYFMELIVRYYKIFSIIENGIFKSEKNLITETIICNIFKKEKQVNEIAKCLNKFSNYLIFEFKEYVENLKDIIFYYHSNNTVLINIIDILLNLNNTTKLESVFEEIIHFYKNKKDHHSLYLISKEAMTWGNWDVAKDILKELNKSNLNENNNLWIESLLSIALSEYNFLKSENTVHQSVDLLNKSILSLKGTYYQ
jgi:hypothetical protein